MKQALLSCEIRRDEDIVWVRNKARQISEGLGFSREDQTRVATAVSELARNASQYARGGKVFFSVVRRPLPFLEIIVLDKGDGIKRLRDIEQGRYESPHGMGIGLMGARRLMDDSDIRTGADGTVVSLYKALPAGRQPTPTEMERLLSELSQPGEEGSLEELKRQNEDILDALTELNRNREELIRLNNELEETNRGVVALYAELDEKAHSLRLANESKTAFLSNLTHEFRSPVNAILGISRIIQKEARAEHAEERVRQIDFIIDAASSLSEMVNDLLDIAKIEAGKVQVRVSTFTTGDLLGTMRGLMRPMAGLAGLDLQIDGDTGIVMQTDEGKVAQILRNLISNALKYTEQGGVKVNVEALGPDKVMFTVRDTGIGIEPGKVESIFDEFVQLENSLQERTKGTGLGLPLSRRLARILGGDIRVRSEPGRGSEFQAVVDRVYHGAAEPVLPREEGEAPAMTAQVLPAREVLLVDDAEADRYRAERELDGLGLNLHSAASVDEGLRLARAIRPDLIVLDLVMPGKGGLDFINERLNIPDLREVPIILHTSKALEHEEKAFLEQSVARIVYKDSGQPMLRTAVQDIIAAPRT